MMYSGLYVGPSALKFLSVHNLGLRPRLVYVGPLALNDDPSYSNKNSALWLWIFPKTGLVATCRPLSQRLSVKRTRLVIAYSSADRCRGLCAAFVPDETRSGSVKRCRAKAQAEGKRCRCS
jgi:hypothetical protein